MFTGIYQSIVMLTVIIVFYVSDFFLISYYDQERRAKGSGRNWDFAIMSMILAGFIVVPPICCPWLGLQTDSWLGLLVQTIGIVFLLSAQGLHWWARLHLCHFYAERVELQPDHHLVDSGPYAYVRHPVFTSFFMYVIGLLLVNPALPTLLVAIYVLWDFSAAAKQEEILLSNSLPSYVDYMVHTGRFLPSFRYNGGAN